MRVHALVLTARLKESSLSPQSYTAGMSLTARRKILLGRLKVNIFLHSKKEWSCYKHSGGVPAKSVSEDSLLEFSKVSLLLFEVLGK